MAGGTFLALVLLGCLAAFTAAQNDSLTDQLLVVCTKDTPPMSQCSADDDPFTFTGYDVEVFRGVATLVGLQENVNYRFRCMKNVDELVKALEWNNGTCDIGTGGITVSTDREARGLQFSYPTYSSTLGVLVPATVENADGWFFVKPFSWTVWLAIGLSLLVFPFIAYVVESLSLKGRIRHDDWRPGLRKSYWEASWLAMQNGASGAQSSATRIMLLAYGAMAVVLLNCYSANLTAFLTISKIQTSIRGINDLQREGRAVGSVGVYIERLKNIGIKANSYSGFSYQMLGDGSSLDWLSELQGGLLAAFVYDDPLLRYIDSISSCDVRMLEGTSLPFDYAMIFANSTNPELLRSVDSAILLLQEDGTTRVPGLGKLRDKFMQFDLPQCKLLSSGSSDGFSIQMSQVWGVWALFGCCLVFGLIVAAILIPRRKKTIERRQTLSMHGSIDLEAMPSSAWGDLINGKESSFSTAPSAKVSVPVAVAGAGGRPSGGIPLEQVQHNFDAAVEQMQNMLRVLQQRYHQEVKGAAPAV